MDHLMHCSQAILGENTLLALLNIISDNVY